MTVDNVAATVNVPENVIGLPYELTGYSDELLQADIPARSRGWISHHARHNCTDEDTDSEQKKREPWTLDPTATIAERAASVRPERGVTVKMS